jgi:tungstate transport system ATP-binding protein
MNSDSRRTGPIHFSYENGSLNLTLENLELVPGKILIISGENGSGKTTLLKILGGLLKQSSTAEEQEAVNDISRNSVYLHQNPYLFRGTVHRNLVLAGPGLDEKHRIDALKTVGLELFLHRKVKTLSGGEATRAALARAFLSEREILLLDEPTAHVDKASMLLIEKACRRLADRGRTLVITSHRGGFAYRVADSVVQIRDGRVFSSATNILKGGVIRESDGYLHFHSGRTGFLVPNRDGDFMAAVIAGKDIILSRQPLESSARNCLEGTLTSLEAGPDGLVTAMVDCGQPLISVITESAVSELDLSPGETVFATFKASSVSLY